MQDVIKDFERNMSEMVSGFLENVQGLMSNLRNLENLHHEQLLESAIILMEKHIKSELDDQITDELRDVSNRLAIRW